ncbi:hypothetical protein ABUK73_04495 [Agrobacterium sp. BA1120]|uniref:hypothetical protein n=1 Tax=Agrobacterium sp. BA1120 TaxID=3228927 RepID=UPI00336A24F9
MIVNKWLNDTAIQTRFVLQCNISCQAAHVITHLGEVGIRLRETRQPKSSGSPLTFPSWEALHEVSKGEIP